MAEITNEPRFRITHHILPNIACALIVQFTLNFPSTILLETSLSFLGLGIHRRSPA